MLLGVLAFHLHRMLATLRVVKWGLTSILSFGDSRVVLRLKSWIAGAAILASGVGAVRADEGMWTFDNVPVAKIQQMYGFKITKEWLDHVRLSSVRLNDGGSGSFISSDGLLLTNHHVARGQLQKSSTAAHDYIKNGFYAASPAEELRTPDLEIDVLQSMEDVTAQVGSSAKGLDATAALKATRAAIAKLEEETKQKTGLVGQVVSLYGGGEYWLYRYKRYTDVRIVFAPEAQTAFFGGDPDNFTYPRYDLDMAIFRVYDNGKPLQTPNFLKWNAKGAAAHELVFVSGNPGSTQRDETMADFKLESQVIGPMVLNLLKHRVETLQKFSARGPEQARQAASLIFGLQNSLKVYEGRKVALADPEILAKKQAEETDFKQKVAANPKLQTTYGTTWDEVATGDAKLGVVITQLSARSLDSSLASLANALVNYADQVRKPDAEREPGFHDSDLQSLKFRLSSPAPVFKELDEARMTGSLEQAKSTLPATDPWLAIVLDGKTPAAVAHAYVTGTHMDDAAVRKSLLEGGESAVEASTDPLIVLARKLLPLSRDARKQRDALNAPIQQANEKLGKARFAVYGTKSYPDATFTLRLSYGSVDGYPMNGTVAPPMTTIYGLYDRSASFGDKSPFDIPARWEAAKDKLDLSTPMDFVTTNDIIGGNSGSPVINKEGEIVGLVFDGNIESLAGDFVYDGTRNRTVAVHTAVMTEALRKVYSAGALADEIQGVQH